MKSHQSRNIEIKSPKSHLWQVLPDEQSCQVKGGVSDGHYTQMVWASPSKSVSIEPQQNFRVEMLFP